MKRVIISIFAIVAVAISVNAQPAGWSLPKTPSDPSFTMKELKLVSGGKSIYGELYTPNDGPSKKPLIIMSHGFNGSHIGFYDVIAEVAKDGFVCYCFDFPGGSSRSKSEGSTEDMTIFTERENLIDIVDYFRGMDGIDAKNIFLLGESQGGLESAMAAAKIAKKVKAIALMYPAFSIPFSTAKIYPDGNIPEKINVMGMNLGGIYYTSMEGYDLYKDIAKFKKPVLIVHGDADALVNKSVSDEADKVYKKSEYHIIAGGDHGFNAPANRAECRQYLRAFFNAQYKK